MCKDTQSSGNYREFERAQAESKGCNSERYKVRRVSHGQVVKVLKQNTIKP